VTPFRFREPQAGETAKILRRASADPAFKVRSTSLREPFAVWKPWGDAAAGRHYHIGAQRTVLAPTNVVVSLGRIDRPRASQRCVDFDAAARMSASS